MKVRSLLLETHDSCATRQAAKALGQEEEGACSRQEGRGPWLVLENHVPT